MKRSDTRYSRGRIALDLVVAYSVLALFGAVSFALYLPLHRGVQPQNVVIPFIANGETRSLLMSGGICVGEVTTKLTTDETPSLDTVLSIRSKVHGEEAITTARLGAHFNPLYQLGRGSLSIESSHFSATITATDVTPIRVVASGRLGPSIRSVELTIPGPVSLMKNDSSSHRLEYANLPSSLGGSASRDLLARIAHDLAMSITPVSLDSKGCAEMPSGSLNLTPLLTSFGPFVQPLIAGVRP